MFMLDKTRLDYSARTNPVKVVRAVAAMVTIFNIILFLAQVSFMRINHLKLVPSRRLRSKHILLFQYSFIGMRLTF